MYSTLSGLNFGQHFEVKNSKLHLVWLLWSAIAVFLIGVSLSRRQWFQMGNHFLVRKTPKSEFFLPDRAAGRVLFIRRKQNERFLKRENWFGHLLDNAMLDQQKLIQRDSLIFKEESFNGKCEHCSLLKNLVENLREREVLHESPPREFCSWNLKV